MNKKELRDLITENLVTDEDIDEILENQRIVERLKDRITQLEIKQSGLKVYELVWNQDDEQTLDELQSILKGGK